MNEKKKILIIEDDMDMRTVYSEVLRGAGFDVIESADGAQGRTNANSINWDLMLLDFMVAQREGKDLLADIQNNPDLKNKPFLLLTNPERDHVIEVKAHIVPTGYLDLNSSPDEIVGLVNRLLFVPSNG